MSKRDKFIGGVVAVLLIVNIILLNKVNSLEQKMQTFDYIQHEIQSVHSSVNNISSQVHTKLEEFTQEQLWISKKNYQVTNVDLEKDTIDVVMEWTLRDLLDGENVTFLFREKSEDDWTELNVEQKSGLNYALEYSFPLEGNFETQIMAESKSNKRSESLFHLNFKEQLDNRIGVHAFLHHAGNGNFDMHIDIQNRLDQELPLTNKKKDLKIKSAKAILYTDGKVKKEIDLLDTDYKENIDHNYNSDSHTEHINYHQFLPLDQVGDDVENIELRVIIVDGLGLTYETIADTNK